VGRDHSVRSPILREKQKIIIPIFDCITIDQMDSPPTADQVAIAIIAACGETGADPEDVIGGRLGTGQNFPISRARTYAALALRAIFPDNGNVAFGRMVGSRSPGSFVTLVDHQIKDGTLKWWDDAVFMRVVEAIEAAQ
jgi:hypothetical protein